LIRLLLGSLVCFAAGNATFPAAAQSDDLRRLFEMVEPRQELPAGRVDVVGWITQDGQGPVLRIGITATDGARLVADPGIRVEPIDETGGLWANAEPLEHMVIGQAYFDAPQTVDVQLLDTRAGIAEADVLFAYCLVDEICLFGEERVSVPLGMTGGG